MTSFEIESLDRLTDAFISSLESQNVMARKEIEKLLIKARETKQSIVDLLQEKGVSKEAVLKAKSAALGGISWVDITTFTPEPELAKLVPQAMAARHNVLCIGKKEGKLVVAMSDPTDAFAVEYVTMRTGSELIPKVALEKDLKEAINRLYGKEDEKGSPQSPKSIGSGGKEAVEESSLQEVRKKPLLSLNLEIPVKASSHTGLLALTRELSATLEIDKLLLKIISAAQQLCRAQESSVLLYDESLHLLYFKCASGSNGEALKQVVLPVTEESVAGWVALHREGVLVNDAQKEKRHYKGIDQLLKFKTRNLICVPILVGGKLHGVLEAINKKEGEFTAEDMEQLEFLAAHSGVCLANASHVDELHDYFLHSVEILIAAVEAIEPTFKGHITEVARLCTAIAKDLGISGKMYETISYAALLHDVGKLRVSPLPGPEIEKQHPVLGAEMLKEMKILKDAIPLIKMHHEKFDASGFPEGLSGEAIPLGARVLSLAEDFAEWREGAGWSRPVDDFVRERGGCHDPRVLGSLQKVVQTLPLRKSADEPLG